MRVGTHTHTHTHTETARRRRAGSRQRPEHTYRLSFDALEGIHPVSVIFMAGFGPLVADLSSEPTTPAFVSDMNKETAASKLSVLATWPKANFGEGKEWLIPVPTATEERKVERKFTFGEPEYYVDARDNELLNALAPLLGRSTGLAEPVMVSIPNTSSGESSDALAQSGTPSSGGGIIVTGSPQFGSGTLGFQAHLGANTAPDAVDDDVLTDEEIPVVIHVTANDSDPDGDVITIQSVTQGSHGSVQAGGNAVVYTPEEDWSGDDSFTYTIDDGLATDTATVYVTVFESNDAPNAVDDEFTLTEDEGAVILDVMGNDTDPEGDDLQLIDIAGPGNGCLEVNDDGTVTYTPHLDANGEDVFVYTVWDGHGGQDRATVRLTVTAVNDVPVATNDAYKIVGGVIDNYNVETLMIEPVPSLLANDIDYDGSPITVVEGTTSAEDGGQVELFAQGSFSYAAPEGLYGQWITTFTYRITDGTALSQPAKVTLFVYQAPPPLQPCEPCGLVTLVVDIPITPQIFDVNDDLYYLGADDTVLAGNVMGNDVGVYVAIALNPPRHGRTNPDEPNNGGFRDGGSFDYYPGECSPGQSETIPYRGYDPHGYSLPATLQIVKPTVDLGIFNGQFGKLVADPVETLVGAFTVANLNNTDNDALIDNVDPFVFPVIDTPLPDLLNAPGGVPEVDLMQLIIGKPNDPNPDGSKVVLTVTGGGAKLWDSPFKGTEITDREFVITEPKVVWVEATAASGGLRDIVITATYRNVSDTVKATAIWVTKTGFRTNGNAPSVSADDATYRREFQKRIQTLGATQITPRVTNNMEMEFTVSPLGVGQVPGIVFDISRDAESKGWRTDAMGNRTPLGRNETFPPNLDSGNDDTGTHDEDNLPLDNKIYSLDTPGYPSDGTGVFKRVEHRGNYFEFVRVSVNGGSGAQGSRASTFVAWRSRLDAVEDPNNPHPMPGGRFYFMRQGTNEIVEGHTPLGT